MRRRARKALCTASAMADGQLHRDMTKTELDAYLRRCGATETNTYSVDDIFHAVDSNLWVDEIVPALGFAHLTPATLSKVRITLSAAKKRRRSEAQPEPKEKDAFRRSLARVGGWFEDGVGDLPIPRSTSRRRRRSLVDEPGELRPRHSFELCPVGRSEGEACDKQHRQR